MSALMVSPKEQALQDAVDRWRQYSKPLAYEHLPPPKFLLFELAVSEFQNSDGVWFTDIVQVVGIQVNERPCGLKEWLYLVRVISPPSESHLDVGYQDLFSGSALRRFHLPMTGNH